MAESAYFFVKAICLPVRMYQRGSHWTDFL
jgi:hypothetical protein